MPVLTVDTVLASLRRFALLTPEQLARVEAATRKTNPPPDLLIRRLVERGWLTAYQAEHLPDGRAADLVLGPYVLLARMGEGGMGIVYQARHKRLGRVDAVKVIRREKLASGTVARRFLREIRLTSGLDHPNIVRARDAGQEGDRLYLATEFIRGEDLGHTVLRSGPLSVADACLVVYQMSQALQHIHDRGLIHRDIKPSNVMREEATGAVKLLDLGLSGFRDPADAVGSHVGPLTRDGIMLGTPDFMPPEQARDPRRVDIRADLYGLGCTFFFLLTGRLPYTGSPVEKLMQHATAPVPPLVLPNGPTPPALAAVVARLMAKEAGDRYPTPRALADAMLALRPGQRTPTPDTVSESTDEWQSQFDQLIIQDESRSRVLVRRIVPATPATPPRWWLMALLLGVAGASLIVFAVIRFSVASAEPTHAHPTSPGHLHGHPPTHPGKRR